MPSYVNKHSTLYEPDAMQIRKKRRQKVFRVPNTRSCSHENQRTHISSVGVRSDYETSKKQDITGRSFSPISPEVSRSAMFCNSSLWDFLHLSLEAASTSHCQTGPRTSAALLQDLSCWTTDRAHMNKGFASKSTGLDTKFSPVLMDSTCSYMTIN